MGYKTSDKQMTLVFSSYRLVEKQEKEKKSFSSNTRQNFWLSFSFPLLDSAIVDNVHVQTTEAREDAGRKEKVQYQKCLY